ncbi:calcium/calmodulin-dependent 3',5'-cyclic nucleotide phosphodiesterase 1C-like isoform X2 [Acanthaster planci]|uniref:Phosphodiesterase n=1 Tax=Acanthaster planci TaxID=133434 RepID=A0A8B7YDF0_ACAPL|nr:calcium/calmodulin-dependent 3',5'-cyclic nucleotide phosphodiesterase 1C-like isoform X2 [Acanthaster planci]
MGWSLMVIRKNMNNEEDGRRGGISFDRTDKAAIYVRMLGDVRVKSKQLMSRADGRRGSLPDSEYKIIEAIDNNVRRTSLKHSRELSLPKVTVQATAIKSRPPIIPESSSHLDSWYCGQANQLLTRLSCWDFNIFHLEQVTGGHSLRFLGMQLFQKYDLIHKFQLDPTNLWKCLVAIETGYHGNPYHNALHAADVTQAMYCYLQEMKLREVLTPIEVMSAILASATHDLDHPGVNQVFLIATSNHLAELYGNSSVLENHHWRAAISVLRESKLLDHLDKKLWDCVVEQISSLILATDIARQQEFLQNFKNHLSANDFDMKDAGHKNFILQIALKCADICNPCRRWEISRRWSEMVTEEFYNQGDRERGLKLPLTMNCDRYKNTIQQIQAGFMKFVVEPLFTEWHRFMPTELSDLMLSNVHKNKASWEAFGEQEKAAAENDRLANQKLASKLRKVEGQSAVNTKEGAPAKSESASKEAQLNNNNNATTAGVTMATTVLSSAGAVLRDVQVSSAMDVDNRSVDVHNTTSHVTESIAEEPSSASVTQGKTDTQGRAQPQNRSSRGVTPQENPTLSQMPSRSALSSDYRRQRPLSVGNLEEVSVSRDEKHGLAAPSKMHSNPGSPVVSRTQAVRQFSLRLHRSPEQAIPKPTSYEDPWLVRTVDPNRTNLSISMHNSPRQEVLSPESSTVSKELGSHRTQPFSSDRGRTFKEGSNTKGYELTTGINNNLSVHVQPGSPRLETTSVRGHGLYSVPSPSPVNRSIAHSRLTTSSTGSKFSHSTHQLQVSYEHSSASDRGHRLSPHVNRRDEAPHREPGRGPLAGRSLAEMGSPWIRKRMEERDQRRRISKSSSISPSLSPRPPPRMLGQATSSWYSVPPALGPVIQDFTSSQLASIAQHKKQSKEMQSKTVPPTTKGDSF